jgi:hypothetical protein
VEGAPQQRNRWSLLSPRRLFLDMCVSARQRPMMMAGPVVSVHRLVADLTFGCVNIHSVLVSRRRFFRRMSYLAWWHGRAFDRLLAQIDSIRGRDVVFHRLCAQIDRLNKKSDLKKKSTDTDDDHQHVALAVRETVQFACSIGHVERMAHLARRIRDECNPATLVSASSSEFLHRLIHTLHRLLSDERDARLALGMALHPRLGAGAGIASLGEDVLLLCVGWSSAVSEPVATWRDVVDGCD